MNFFRPIRLRLSSCVSAAAVLIVPFLFFHANSPLSPSSGVSFVIPTFPPLFHIYSAVSIASRLRRRILCHPCPPPLSSCFSASTVLIKIIFPFTFHLPSSPSSHISSSAIIFILHICCISDVAVSVVLRLYCCHIHL